MKRSFVFVTLLMALMLVLAACPAPAPAPGAGTTADATATEALEEPTEAATETPMAEETSEITGTTEMTDTEGMTDGEEMTDTMDMTDTMGMTDTMDMTDTTGMTDGEEMTDTMDMTDTTGMTDTAGMAGDGTVMVTEDDELGEILTDGAGFTLYLFTNDTQNAGTSTCTGGCLENWPPFIVNGEATAGEGVDEALLGTITLDDGTTQATYNGWPLYYYVDDLAAGDTTGQGVGDVWYALTPEGEQVE
jgi:predicted lipoprotein with Yx(FWY)xxD motif